MFKNFNPNPNGAYVGDCVIRAICKALDYDWHRTYLDVCIQGYMMCDMPSSNHVWGAYLQKKGFTRSVIPNNCPDCYTVQDFCNENAEGVYILAISYEGTAWLLHLDEYKSDCPDYYIEE